MNKKLKYLSFLAVIPLLLVFFSPGLLGIVNVEAQNTDDRTGLQPFHYVLNSQAVTCGDHLCNEHYTVSGVSPDNVIMGAPTMHEHMPLIQVLEAHNFRGTDPNAYIVTIKLTAGAENLENVKITAQSDIDSVDSDVGGIFAGDDKRIVVRIHALNTGTIHAKVSSYQLGESQGVN